MSETLNVDNDPVNVSLSTPNDPNPTVWVNHAVTVDATPSTGPSGLGGMNCSVNGAAAQTYPAAGLTVAGDGVKTVTCTAWNNAVDPQGNHNSGTSSVSLHIDEAPPVLSLAPVNPNDPTAVVADTSDSESGVAGGSIEMAPAGTGSWTSLPTTFTGSQLLAHFNDAGLNGSYSFKVTSCDNVGNCASTTRTMMLPARISRDLRRHRGDDAHGALQRGAGQDCRGGRACTNRFPGFQHRSAPWTVPSESCARRHVPAGSDPGAHRRISAGNVFATASAGRPARTVTP